MSLFFGPISGPPPVQATAPATLNYALFDRFARFSLAVATTDPILGIEIAFNDGAPADQPEGLRIQFRVAKNPRAKEPNTAKIEIYNLNKRTRDEFDAALKRASETLAQANLVGPPLPGFASNDASVRLDAGYKGGHGQIFKGHATEIVHSHEGPNWVTRILASDGAITNQIHVKFHQKKGMTPGAIIKTIVDEIGKKFKDLNLADVYKKVQAGDLNAPVDALKRALSFSDIGMSGLDKYLTGTGYEVSEQDGVLQLLHINEIADPANVVVLNSDTGLVGRVLPVRDDKRPDAFIIKAQSLLRHEIFIGSGVQIDGAVYKVRELTHAGDTYGSDWTTTFEAVAVKTV